MSKRLILSIPESMYDKIKQEKEKYCYFSMQEAILNILREKFYMHQQKDKSAATERGRPHKLDPMKIITRKKIFSDHGGVRFKL
jgi:hypothetical protein